MPQIHVLARSLDEVERAVRRLGRKLGASDGMFPTYATSEQSGRPHIEYAEGRFHFVQCERGTEFERRSTDDVNLLLYWIFAGITFQLAHEYVLSQRQPRTDSRRMLFAKREELMALLDDDWARRLAAEHAAILEEHPFDDLGSERLAFYKELRATGRSAAEATRLSDERYPRPAARARG